METQQWTDQAVPVSPFIRRQIATRIPQPGGEIVLIRYRDLGMLTKEYGAIVLGEEVNNKLGERLSRAQDAIDAAKSALPGIKERQAALRAAILKQQEANT